MTRSSTPPAPPRRRAALPGARTVAAVALPLLALSRRDRCSDTHGYHIDLEVYRIGVATWLAGGDMYGPLPPTVSGWRCRSSTRRSRRWCCCRFELLPWTAAWVRCSCARWRRWRPRCTSTARQAGRPVAPAARCRSRALALPVRCWIEPVLETFEFGQVNLVLMALVAVDCLAARTRWPRGLLVGPRRGDQADPRGVRAVLPPPPRHAGGRRHDRHRRRRDRARVRRRRGVVGPLLVRRPGLRRERVGVLHEPDRPGRSRARRGARLWWPGWCGSWRRWRCSR